MPTYVYFCDNEKKVIEVYQKITEDTLNICPYCESSKIKRVPAQCSFVLRGDNWEKKSGY